MTDVSVQFFFDFGSANAYMSHRVIPAITNRTGVKFDYVPMLLGGLFKLSNNRSPAETLAEVPNKRAYNKLELARFMAAHDIRDFQPNPYWPLNTMQIMRAAVAAQQLGCSVQYVDTMFSQMWEQGKDLSNAEVILSALNAAGLNGQALISATQDPLVKGRLVANTQQAYERGAFGSPTFFVGDQMFFGKDRLREVEEEIRKQQTLPV